MKPGRKRTGKGENTTSAADPVSRRDVLRKGRAVGLVALGSLTTAGAPAFAQPKLSQTKLHLSASIQKRLWDDKSFLEAFLKDPAAVLRREKVSFSPEDLPTRLELDLMARVFPKVKDCWKSFDNLMSACSPRFIKEFGHSPGPIAV